MAVKSWPAYYELNGKKIRARSREWYAQNKERVAKRRAADPQRTRTYRRQYYVANAEKFKQNNRDSIALRRAFVDAAIAGGCADCGTKEQVVLDLDHVRGRKLGSVSRMVNTKVPLRILLAEIDKCEPRCANCHRRITAERRRAVA